MFQSTTIPLLEQVVQFAQSRHGVLAGNLANLDTPGYQAVDLSPQLFEQRLHRAIEARDRNPATTAIDSHFHSDPIREVGASLSGILRHDQGDVSVEKQVAEITKNQTVHNLALTIMTSQFRQLQTAISERVV